MLREKDGWSFQAHYQERSPAGATLATSPQVAQKGIIWTAARFFGVWLDWPTLPLRKSKTLWRLYGCTSPTTISSGFTGA